eukprot:scaffold196944_cov42-Prasinocladus_malaysianus.AAC.1
MNEGGSVAQKTCRHENFKDEANVGIVDELVIGQRINLQSRLLLSVPKLRDRPERRPRRHTEDCRLPTASHDTVLYVQ